MNVKGLDMKKLEKAAAEAGISPEDLAKGLAQYKSKVARMAASFASDGSGDR